MDKNNLILQNVIQHRNDAMTALAHSNAEIMILNQKIQDLTEGLAKSDTENIQ